MSLNLDFVKTIREVDDEFWESLDMTIVANSHKSFNKSSQTFWSYILQFWNIDALTVIENY